ncbi:MAG: translation initiation factor IF-3, partial [Gammaproteobacteria bacterium]
MASVKEVRRNEEITAREVRVIDAEGEQVGVVATERALEMAEDVSLDLVEISPN